MSFILFKSNKMLFEDFQETIKAVKRQSLQLELLKKENKKLELFLWILIVY